MSDSVNQASETPTPDHRDHRDQRGRFQLGNKGGPGNPFARRVAELKRLLLNCVSDDDLRAAVDSLIEKAKNGDVAAAKLLFSYALGKPTTAVEPDRVEIDELRLRNESCPSFAEWAPHLENMPAAWVNPFIDDVAPAMQAPFLNTFRKGFAKMDRDDRRTARKAAKKAMRRHSHGNLGPSANGHDGAPRQPGRPTAPVILRKPDDRGRAG
jgi:hypothetical protein